MLERYLKRSLEAKMAEVAQDRDTLTAFLRANRHIREAEDEALVDLFLATPPKVYQDLARAHEKFPNVCIILGPEREVEEAENNLIELASAEQADELGIPGLVDVPILGSLMNKELHLYIHAVHPDVAILTYELTKMFMLLSVHDIQAQTGASFASMAGTGLDPIPASEAGGDFIFRRLLRTTFLELFQVAQPGVPIGEYSSIAGLHTAGGSTSSVGNAKTLVYPVTSEDV